MLNVQAKTGQDETHPLAELVESLEQIVMGSEDDFISLGMNLQQVQLLSSSQRQKISSVMGLFQAENGTGLADQLTSYIEGCLQETGQAQQTAAQLCDNLSAMLQLMSTVERDNRSLERIGLLLHVIGVNTGIECARYRDMEATFKVVSKDTTQLAEQIRKATNTLNDKTGQARSEQQATLREARKSIETLEGLAGSTRQTTQLALSKVAELIDYSLAMVNKAEQMAVNITSEIYRVVVGIQFHDNLRQRIEHINTALLESETPHAASTAEQVCQVQLAVELQQAQLDNLIGELAELYEVQSQALGNIIREVTSLEERLASMVVEQRTAAGAGDPVSVLLAGVSELELLNRDSLRLGAKIGASATRAELVVADMQAAIRTTFAIANNVKINALNAIIKASKFGRSGESLQVLAQGMVTVSKDTRHLVADFTSLLKELTALAGQEQAGLVEQPGTTSDKFDCQQLRQVFEDFRAELLASQQDFQSLANSLEKEQRNLVFIARLKETLEQSSTRLSLYRETLPPCDPALLERLRKNFGQHLAERYTMDEERVIHQQVLGVAPTGTATTNSTSGSADVLFFPEPQQVAEPPVAGDEVDLWGGAAACEAAVVAVPESAPAAAEVELWGEAPAASSVPDNAAQEVATATDSESVELWDAPQPQAPDNVELWGAPTEDDTATVELWDDPPESSADTASTVTADAVAAAEDAKNKNAEDFGDNVELF